MMFFIQLNLCFRVERCCCGTTASRLPIHLDNEGVGNNSRKRDWNHLFCQWEIGGSCFLGMFENAMVPNEISPDKADMVRIIPNWGSD